jgi:hypothetical protein
MTSVRVMPRSMICTSPDSRASRSAVIPLIRQGETGYSGDRTAPSCQRGSALPAVFARCRSNRVADTDLMLTAPATGHRPADLVRLDRGRDGNMTSIALWRREP